MEVDDGRVNRSHQAHHRWHGRVRSIHVDREQMRADTRDADLITTLSERQRLGTRWHDDLDGRASPANSVREGEHLKRVTTVAEQDPDVHDVEPAGRPRHVLVQSPVSSPDPEGRVAAPAALDGPALATGSFSERTQPCSTEGPSAVRRHRWPGYALACDIDGGR